MLAQAAARAAGAGVAYVRGDAADLPFRDGSFDAVCCFAALYLIEDPLLAVAEIARVLAPAGGSRCCRASRAGRCPAGVADASCGR